MPRARFLLQLFCAMPSYALFCATREFPRSTATDQKTCESEIWKAALSQKQTAGWMATSPIGSHPAVDNANMLARCSDGARAACATNHRSSQSRTARKRCALEKAPSYKSMRQTRHRSSNIMTPRNPGNTCCAQANALPMDASGAVTPARRQHKPKERPKSPSARMPSRPPWLPRHLC